VEKEIRKAGVISPQEKVIVGDGGYGEGERHRALGGLQREEKNPLK